MKDTELRFCDASDSFLALAGRKSLDEIRGLDDYAMAWGECYARDYRRHDRDALRGLTYTSLEPCIDRDGQTVYMAAYKFPFFDDEGDVAGVVVQTHALKERRAVRAVAELQAQLQTDQIRVHPDLYNLSVELNGPGKLSKRESQILYYQLRAWTAKAIAQELCISVRTVEKHIETIKRKLGLGHRSELVDFGLQHGLMDILPPEVLTRSLCR